jgi:hypothetical protein
MIFSAFQKSKTLPTAYLSRRYPGDKFLFFSFFFKADEVVKRNLKRHFFEKQIKTSKNAT